MAKNEENCTNRTDSAHLGPLLHKTAEIQDMIEVMSACDQLEALDVLQRLVNNVMHSMTKGRVCSVRFVPVASSLPDTEDTENKPSAGDSWSTEPICGPLVKEESDLVEDVVGDEAPPCMMSTPKSTSSIRKGLCSSTSARRLYLSGKESDNTIAKQGCMIEPKLEEGIICTSKELEDSGMGSSILNDSNDTNNSGVCELSTHKSHMNDLDNKATKKASHLKNATPELVKGKKKGRKGQLYNCMHCSFSTARKYSLDSHMCVHSGSSQYKCQECDKYFTTASSLRRHIMIHDGVKPHKCPVCQKTFIDIAGLRTHSTVHTGARLFKCDDCPKSYTNHANLARHKRVHTGEMPYVCKHEGCVARYRDLSSLKLHVLKHTGEKPFSCQFCHKKFKTSSDYRRHERTHTQERNYKCTQCDKTFIQGYHLKQHLKIHANLWLFSCDLCQKKFRTKSSLLHHTKGHAGVKDYKCEKCGNAFTTKRYLNDHYIAAHTDAKPYKCDVCHKGFNHIANMKRHKRMHTNVFRYKCKYCGRGFKYINSLQYHEGIHRGDRKVCDKCGFTCRCAATMRGHVCADDTHKSQAQLPDLTSDSFTSDETDVTL